MLKNNIYRKAPVMLQNVFLTGRGVLYNFLRRGRTFRNIFYELMSTQYFNELEIKEWQNKRLSSLVRHAYENVPYYNRIFKKMHLCPEDIKDVKDLDKLPILTKEDVRRNPNDFLARNARRFFIKETFTSGTSGKPLKMYRDLYSINFENAALWRQRYWGGIDFSDKIAVLREEEVVPFNIKKPPFWRYSLLEKRLFLSAYHLCRESARHYVRAIHDFQPRAIEAEPPSLYIFARFIKGEGLSISVPIKAIFTSSETLLAEHRKLIEEVFGARIYDFYGNAERVTAIGMCEEGRYHVLPEYAITEFLPLNGRVKETEIVGTALHNYAMPLLRYRTGDMAGLSDSDCKCGRRFRSVTELKGRISDFLVTKDGRIAIDIYFRFFKGVANIVESQIIQETLDRIRVRFIPGEDFSETDEKKIINNIRSYMGHEVKVVLEEEDEFVKDKAVKFRPFISHVKLDLIT